MRKISYGEGVERVFPLYSPNVAEIEVVRRGDVRRAKLYYLRARRGKSARITEKTDGTSPRSTPRRGKSRSRRSWRAQQERQAARELAKEQA